MTAVELAALIAFLWFATILAYLWLEHRRRTGDALKSAQRRAKKAGAQ